MSEKLYAISIVTGEVFQIEKEDVKLLYNYQIPLKAKPKSNCRQCYGRGYTGRDSKNHLYILCSCVSKCIMDGYNPTKLMVELPRMV